MAPPQGGMEGSGPLRAQGRHFVPPGRAVPAQDGAGHLMRGAAPPPSAPPRRLTRLSAPTEAPPPAKGDTVGGTGETGATRRRWRGVWSREGRGGARPRSVLGLRVLPARRSFAPRCRSSSRPTAPATAARTGHDRLRRQRRPRGK